MVKKNRHKMKRKAFNQLLVRESIGTEIGGYLVKGVAQYTKDDTTWHFIWMEHVKGMQGREKGRFQTALINKDNMQRIQRFHKKKKHLKQYIDELDITMV